MDALRHTFAGFVRRVRARMVVVRALEGAGAGVLLASGVGMVLVPILWWRGQEALTLAAVLVLAGAVGGVMATLWRWPGIAEAAQKADRQLDLADLLSTAWAVAHRAGGLDEFTGAVLAMAEARCAGLSPSTVILNRFGARMWGSIGLSAALVLVLGLMSVNSESVRAAAAARDIAEAAKVQGASGPRDHDPAQGGKRPLGPAIAADQPREDRPLDDSSLSDATHGDGREQGSIEARAPGQGPGSARSTPTSATERDRLRGTSAGASGGAQAAGGVGRPAARQGAVGDSGASAGAAPQAVAPPWKSDAWPSAQHAAEQAIESGAVPGEYRELVREYFER